MMSWEGGMGVCTLPCVKQLVGTRCIAQGVQFSVLWPPRQVRGRWAGREVQERGDVCMLRALSLHCSAETNTKL